MVYEFKCRCGAKLDIDEKMSEHGKVAHICGECGELMESVISGGGGFHLSGPGWAKDGYKSHGIIQDKKD
jgi:hypothetical protein